MIELPAINEKFITPAGELRILQLLGKGKSGYSFLASDSSNEFVLKIMHDEPNPYYRFNENKVKTEVMAFNELVRLKLNVPHIIYHDYNKNYLIKEFIDGDIAAHSIAEGKISDNIIGQLFKMYRVLKQENLNIDYFPTNFVISKQELFYIDYEINVYEEQWDLINWGIYYWANTEGFSKFLNDGDAFAINSDLDKGLPIKEPFEDKVRNWINLFFENK